MSGDLNIPALVLGASLPVKLVLILLIVFSFTSWVIRAIMLWRVSCGSRSAWLV